MLSTYEGGSVRVQDPGDSDALGSNPNPRCDLGRAMYLPVCQIALYKAGIMRIYLLERSK